MADIYVNQGQKIYGPFTTKELKKLAESGKIRNDAQVRVGTDGNWILARSVSGLFESTAPIVPSVLASSPSIEAKVGKSERATDEYPHIDESFENGNKDSDDIAVESRLGNAISTAAVTVGVIVGYIGGFALWIWAVALLLDNWGIVGAAIAFVAFPLSLIVVVMCFFWGVPYFFLAFLAWISAWVALFSAGVSKKLAVIALLGVLTFGASGAYFAWRDVTNPDPISTRDMDRLTDDAFALIAILRASQDSNDAELAIGNTRAKARLREELSKYDTSRIDAIDAIVGRYLKYQMTMERDLMTFLALRSEGKRQKFSVSAATKGALSDLPDRIRTTFATEVEDLERI